MLKGKPSLSSTSLFYPSHLTCVQEWQGDLWQQQDVTAWPPCKGAFCTRWGLSQQPRERNSATAWGENWLPPFLLESKILDYSNDSSKNNTSPVCSKPRLDFFVAVQMGLLTNISAQHSLCFPCISKSPRLQQSYEYLSHNTLCTVMIWALTAAFFTPFIAISAMQGYLDKLRALFYHILTTWCCHIMLIT